MAYFVTSGLMAIGYLHIKSSMYTILIGLNYMPTGGAFDALQITGNCRNIVGMGTRYPLNADDRLL